MHIFIKYIVLFDILLLHHITHDIMKSNIRKIGVIFTIE